MGPFGLMHGLVDALKVAPGVLHLRRASAERNFASNVRSNLFRGVFATAQAALASAPPTRPLSYDNEGSANLYLERLQIDDYDYPSMFWLKQSFDEGMTSLVDVGGSIGIKYLAFRDALAPWPDLRWTVHDVPAAVAHGRALSATRGDSDRLSFGDHFDDLQDCDVFYASGVLQYLPQTLGAALSNWKQRPKRIIINTTPIHPEQAYFTVNSIGTAFCPYRVQTQAGLVRELTKLNYKVREAWINPDKRMQIPMQPELSLQHYSGYCLDRKD